MIQNQMGQMLAVFKQSEGQDDPNAAEFLAAKKNLGVPFSEFRKVKLTLPDESI